MIETQRQLQDHIDGKYPCSFFFDEMYPIWRCPDCLTLNRTVLTFGELCKNCKRIFSFEETLTMAVSHENPNINI
jgi:hypothetical protein